MDFKTDFKPLTVDPDKIYDYSFSIIAEEMGEHDFSEDEWKVVRRIIHASADFELGRSVIISPVLLKRVSSLFLQDVMSLQMCK